MNLPNSITMGRFALALLLFGYLVLTDVCSGPDWRPPAIAGSAFILVVITDALDGYYARKLGQQTDFGRIADPVVDKVLICGALIFLASVQWAREFHPQLVWIVVVLVSREFMVSGLRGFIESRGHAFPARWDGKLKMVLQCIVVPAIFLQHALDLSIPGVRWLVVTIEVIAVLALWLTFVVTITSGARYIAAAAKVLSRDGDGAGA
jgi:CDP-diacylglycerol--glycerol-3-phosphate 3-phosphatidyltransferase